MKNDYEIRGEVTAIFLKNRKGEVYETLIDTEDLERIKELNLSWHLRYADHTDSYYAHAAKYLGMKDGKPRYKTISLHIEIMGNPEGKVYVDHINHDTLDNRKENLRVASNTQNSRHRSRRNSNNTSGYRNVSWDKSWKKWKVQMQVNGKNAVLGLFDDVHEAGEFAKLKRQEIYGEYAGEGH